MSRVLFEPGDQVPELELVRAERVQTGDIVWGIQWQDNLRKGFLLETEGVELSGPAVPVQSSVPGLVKVGSWAPMDRHRMLLVQVLS